MSSVDERIAAHDAWFKTYHAIQAEESGAESNVCAFAVLWAKEQRNGVADAVTVRLLVEAVERLERARAAVLPPLPHRLGSSR